MKALPYRKNFGRTALSLSVAALLSGNALAGTGYVVTNKADSNTIIGFNFDEKDGFTTLGEFATGGKGTGDLEVPGLSPRDDNHPLLDGLDPLISAYGIEKTADGKFVVVVNPGDGTISSLKVGDDMSLSNVSTVKAGGAFPVSVAIHDNVVAVASIGKGNFKGYLTSFRLADDGSLSKIEKSRIKLGSFGGRPSSVRFTPDGKFVVVTHILSGVIAVFPINDGKIHRKPVSRINSVQADSERWLANPVGFVMIDKGDKGSIAVVSEARFFKPGLTLDTVDGQFNFETSSSSSYSINPEGEISLISGDAFTGAGRTGGQRTNCWIGLSANGKYAYGVNALDSSISSYSVDDSGKLTLLQEVAYKTPEFSFLTDIYPSDDGQYFYQLHGAGGKVSVLKIQEDGSLKEMGVWDGGVPEVGSFGVLAI